MMFNVCFPGNPITIATLSQATCIKNIKPDKTKFFYAHHIFRFHDETTMTRTFNMHFIKIHFNNMTLASLFLTSMELQ